MNKFTYTFLLGLLVLVTQAQELVLRPQNLKFETKITEPLSLRKGFLRGSVSYVYSPYDCYFNANGNRTKLLMNDFSMGNRSGRSSYDVSYLIDFEYGITDRWGIEIGIPFIKGKSLWQEKMEVVPANYFKNESHEVETDGVADLSTYLSYQFLIRDDFFAKCAVGVYIPFGKSFSDTISISPLSIKKSASYNRDKPMISSVLDAKKIFYPFALELISSYTYYFDNDRQESFSNFQLNGHFGVLLNDWFSINNSWRYMYVFPITYKEAEGIMSFTGSRSYQLSSGVSIIQQVKHFRFNEEIQFPITGKDIASNMNLIFSIAYTL